MNEPSHDHPHETGHDGLTVIRHDLGRADLPIYRAETIDHGDRLEFTLPDGRRGTIRSRAAQPGDLVRSVMSPGLVAYDVHADPNPTVVSAIEYRTCDWPHLGPGRRVIQVLSYELACGSPPNFCGCPCLDVEEL